MATANIAYAADTALITCTLANLAHGSMRESSMIDNTSNKYLDVSLQLALITSNNLPVGADKSVYVYFYGGVKPNQLTYPVTGTDAAVTVASAGNLIGPFVIAVTDQSATIETIVPSVATYFGGVLPPYWGITVYNQTSCSLGAEATKSYLGITETIA